MRTYSLTNSQNSIWLTEKFFSNTSINNIGGYVEISEPVNFEILKNAMYEVVKTNDSMRLKFTEENNNCLQYVDDFKLFNIDILEVNSKADMESIANNMISEPLYFSDKYLFKFAIFKLPNNFGGFIISIHHIISDSWSAGLLVKEIINIYSKMLENTYVPFQYPSYLNYIDFENEYLNNSKFIKDKEYWNTVFKTIPEIASIPSFNKNSSSNISCNGAREKFNISKETIIKVNNFCDVHKFSLYNFFMSVYSLYISRVTNLDDFVIGTPILNRTNFEQKHTMGMFISTSPLRINVNNELSFKDFCKTVATNIMSLFRHQRYPYQFILEDLRKKDSNIPNLYNIVLSYQITKTLEDDVSVKHSTNWVFNGNCADDIQIHLFDLNDEKCINVAYDYNSDKYTKQDIASLHNRILTIIDQILVNNDILLNDIEIVTPEEKNKILYDFNNTKVDYPKNKTIIDLFEEQVAKNPNNIAVVFGDKKLTYKELNEKANYWANQISKNNIFDKNICIILDKSIEMIVAIFSVLKSGNTYVPINPKYPDARIRYIMNSVNCELLLTSKNYENIYSNENKLIIDLNNYSNININKSSSNNKAYIIFTSGTTGNPKGVKILNKNIVNTLLWRKNYYNFNTETRTLQIPSFAFDSSVEDIFTTLISGGQLIIPSYEITNLDKFNKDIITYHITHFLITPALYTKFLEQYSNATTSLTKITIAGEDFDYTLLKKHFTQLPNTKLYNEYGPTENSVCSTVYEFSSDCPKILIGKPIYNSNAYVVSHVGKLCPIGVPGELWVGGDGVASGYLNNEKLTCEKFINNPFGEGKVYKTGDLVKWLPDGNIDFIGRIDNQVKIRGFRIELSEIDTNILKFPNIKQSVSIVQNVNNNKAICSYIVSEKNISIKDLKSFLSKSLANYMIPAHIIQLDKLPLNINGKIDRKLLPMPEISHTSLENIIPSRNTTDSIIILCLKEILNLQDISIADSFFDIGGDSLSAITFSNKLSSKLNCSVTVQDVFNHPVIQDLSDYISILSNTKTRSIKRQADRAFYPLSSAQKRIYYSYNLDNNSILYNTSGGLILDKELDFDKLNNAFKILIARHDSLRTHFDILENEVVQVIDNKINFKLKLEYASDSNLNKIYSKFVKPFDLTKAPLFRVKLVKLQDNRMLLLLDMHHIISDGTSLNILLKELCALYNNKTLPEKHIDYKDFTLWEQEEFKSKEFKVSKKFWLNKFKDEIPLLNLDTVYPRPFAKSYEGSNYHTVLSEEIFKKINNTASILGITPFMLMLSCYYILLSKYTGQEDIIVGTPIVGRELPELSNVLGMFVNTLALRNYVDYKLTFDKFSNIVKNNCLSCFKYQNYPFDMLVKDLNVKRDISRNPLFDTMFIFQNSGYPIINFNGINSKYFIPDLNISKFDLSLEVIPINNTYSLRFEYCTKLFDENFIKRFSIHYINILNTILDNNQIRISNIDMLSEEEKTKILQEFNNTKMDYPLTETIVNLFEKQVEKTPNNIAIVFEEQKLTYKELNEKSNQLARYLLENNISTNNVVGIMLPRSLEILISILGVLKAGACYIPIDPTFPKDRIEYMLGDSNASILITNSKVQNVNFDKIININDDIINTYDKTNLCKKISQKSRSYIIYTSGSTGKPKGVVLKHKALVNLAYYLNDNVEYFKNVYANTSIASITTVSFDIFLFETLFSLQRGLKIIIANEKEQTNPILLDKLIEKHNIKAIQMTPSRMEIFINNKEYMPHLKKLKYITLAGEALSLNLKNKILELGNITIYNGYGPSETTVFSTFTNATRQKEITIGKPIYNTYMYVLDKDKHICPEYVPGELYISGDGVGFGYYNNPKLTRKAFVKNPFYPETTMYKTGDLVKRLPSNELLYIGRKDNQVKIRGLRIELDEIQKWISTYPDISKSIVYSCKDNNNRQYIVAYLTITNRISINELKAYLNKYIPKYMVPSYFIILDKFPYLPNGKINRNALPVPDNTVSSNRKKYMAPTNKLEIDIASIFESLLSISPIGINDNFFDMGGDSLLAMSLQLELLKLNINVSYSDIFMYPTVKELADNILLSSKRNLKQIDESIITKYNSILNNTTSLSNLSYSKPGNLLLSGVTGFLGAHILDSFLKNETGKVYCLIRTEPGLSIENKLLNKLHYYFDTKYDDLIGDRIIPVNADIAIFKLGLSDEQLDNLANTVNVVVNSAAKVSHYGDYSEYKRVNVDGTQNLVDFCMKYNKRFYQISTLSVSGNSLVDSSYIKQDFINDVEFNENNFYIHQSLDNVYVRSKFEAEKVVLDNILNGLDGYIIRVGNLMNRFSDGKFQSNVRENAYINRLLAYCKIGYIPDYLLNAYLELTPIDYCADAVLKVIQFNKKENRIFHLLNHKNVNILFFIKTLNKLYGKIEIVNNDKFLGIIDKILNTSNLKDTLSGLINDFDENRKIVYSSPIKIKSDFTIKYLEKIGFDWPELTEDYIIKFLDFYNNLNLLNKGE